MTPLLLIVALALPQEAVQDMTVTVGTLEGRPAAADLSPLQARIDAARPGDRVVVEAGTYTGDLFIHTSIQFVGRGRPRLVGSGLGSVIRVRADDVLIEGFDIDGQLGGSLARDSSGIHVAGRRVTIRDCRIVRSLFGVYLREADDAVVEGCDITGIEGRSAGEQGSGVHVWNTRGFTLRDNRVRYSRDGFYIQSASHGTVVGNEVSHVRYGLHYMNSDDNRFEDNTFQHGAAGAALMYSRRVTFARNRFLHNRGFASVGLLLKDCEDVVAEDNLVADNERGFFIDGAVRHVFRRNLVAGSDVAVVIYASSQTSRFEGNTFVGNLAPLRLVGRRTDTIVDGNYWSEFREPDLDGDGIRDRPYQLSNVFDHLRGNLIAADLFAQGLGARVLSRAEATFPVLRPVGVADNRPLTSPPDRGAIPPMPAPDTAHTRGGLALSALGVIAGLAVFHAGRRR